LGSGLRLSTSERSARKTFYGRAESRTVNQSCINSPRAQKEAEFSLLGVELSCAEVAAVVVALYLQHPKVTQEVRQTLGPQNNALVGK
jgi:hypothetical protein